MMPHSRDKAGDFLYISGRSFWLGEETLSACLVEADEDARLPLLLIFRVKACGPAKRNTRMRGYVAAHSPCGIRRQKLPGRLGLAR